jgi:hypothetical protein
MLTYDSTNFKDVAAPQPSDYIWDGVIKTNEKRPNLLIGLAESGKSTFATQLAVAIAQGAPCLDRATKKSRVLFWKCEDSAEDAKADLVRAGWCDDDPLVLLIPQAEDNNIAGLLTSLAKYQDTKLVVIETILDFLNIKDSNSTEKVKAELKKLSDAMEPYPECAVLLLHWFNKSDMSVDSQSITKINGSHAFATGTASKIYLHRVSDEDPRRWIHISTRRGRALEPTYLVYDKTTATSTLGETRYEEKTREKAQGKKFHEQDLTSKLVQIAAENPGIAKSALAKKIGGNYSMALGQIDQLVTQKLLVVVEGVSIRGGSPPQQVYVKGQAPVVPEELFEQFEVRAVNKQAIATFYNGLNNESKILIWNKYPQHHEALRGGQQ